MASFAQLASVTASTKRVGAVVDGLEPSPTTNIASLSCLPLDPVTPDIAQGVEGLSFREILQTSVEGGLDIVEGDILVVGVVEYPIRAVSEWYWPPDDANYLTLLLEDRKYGFSASDVFQAEVDALIWLYDHTDGDNWTDNTGWKTDRTVENWFGVTVVGGHVTAVDLNNNNLVGDIGGFPIDDLTGLLNLFLYTNVNLSGDISGWTLPATLIYLHLNSTSVSGDISGWTLPATMTDLYLNSTSVSGDISGWTLPATLRYLNLSNTSVSGDISGWTLPATLIYLYLHSTSVSGDISGWTLPATLRYLYLYSTSVSGTPDISGNTAMRDYRCQNCALTQANVDAILLGIYNRRAAFTYASPALNISGTNSVPSGVYQDGDPPTTGLEYVYELANDPESEGFNTWTITYTGGVAP